MKRFKFQPCIFFVSSPVCISFNSSFKTKTSCNFYTFMKSLETYEQTADPETLFIITTDSDLLQFLKKAP